MSDLVVKDKFLYTLADRKFYEPISRYEPNKNDFHRIVSRLCQDNDRVERYKYWFRYSAGEVSLPLQGWKIHVSATPAHSGAILDTVARILVKKKITFKFVADKLLLSIFNGKSFDRGSAGKFITVYPKDDEQFKSLVEELHRATVGFWGPYILSDKRYKSSKVIYYRYGGMLSLIRVIDGELCHVIKNPDGKFVKDERTPFFQLPEGITDPFPDEESEDELAESLLGDGRYKILDVMAFSNAGGVYRATDTQTDETVVLKEGRPYTNVSYRGLDAIQLVKKEHRLLTILEDTDVAAKPIDFFIDWEHAYLVQEYLGTGVNLRGFLARIYLTLKTNPSKEDFESYWRLYKKLYTLVAEKLAQLHEKGIVFGDFSINNLMVLGETEDELEVKLIDFESAFEEGIDLPTHIFTPGYASESYQNLNPATKADDCYALGALLMAGLFPMNGLLSLDRNAHKKYLRELKQDIGVPDEIVSLILSLMSSKAELRPSAKGALRILSSDWSPDVKYDVKSTFDTAAIPELKQGIERFIINHADIDRSDRLFPADPEVFDGNELSLAHGALGVIYALRESGAELPDEFVTWCEDKSANYIPPSVGLMSGSAGIAWAWFELGNFSLAKDALEQIDNSRMEVASPYFFDGLSGLGMAYLKAFNVTNERKYLSKAKDLVPLIMKSAHLDDDDDLYWEAHNTKSATLGHGASGVALFLLYLHLATEDETYLNDGKRCLNWVIKQGHYNEEGGLTWLARETTPSYTPYWRWGSSGIGKVLYRYWRVTNDERYAQLIDDIHTDTNRKYTIFPGFFFGISGIVDFYLDIREHERWEEIADKACKRLFSGTFLFSVETDEGLAFPGESATRLSCDFGTGSAGVLMMLERYKSASKSPFMLDELLPNYT
ncbi:class III lanthionine synthetase LanKC [Idiomarina abyssalis]|uniref:class III lanthionine synthetase LanKC n=1 Tax=Idiomarina abyssalis TaxID=86102 RepID=UPI003A9087D6